MVKCNQCSRLSAAFLICSMALRIIYEFQTYYFYNSGALAISLLGGVARILLVIFWIAPQKQSDLRYFYPIALGLLFILNQYQALRQLPFSSSALAMLGSFRSFEGVLLSLIYLLEDIALYFWAFLFAWLLSDWALRFKRVTCSRVLLWVAIGLQLLLLSLNIVQFALSGGAWSLRFSLTAYGSNLLLLLAFLTYLSSVQKRPSIHSIAGPDAWSGWAEPTFPASSSARIAPNSHANQSHQTPSSLQDYQPQQVASASQKAQSGWAPALQTALPRQTVPAPREISPQQAASDQQDSQSEWAAPASQTSSPVSSALPQAEKPAGD